MTGPDRSRPTGPVHDPTDGTHPVHDPIGLVRDSTDGTHPARDAIGPAPDLVGANHPAHDATGPAPGLARPDAGAASHTRRRSGLLSRRSPWSVGRAGVRVFGGRPPVRGRTAAQAAIRET